MSDKEALHGLGCPRCGGMVPLPEGQVIVICPFCDLRSTVQGERGIRRSQVPRRVDQEDALKAFRKFLSSKIAIARDCARTAQLDEVLLVHLPFWSVWGRGLGWAFGEKQTGSGDNKKYEPREVRVVKELDWNGAACDVGEFGVTRISLDGRPLEPFDLDQLQSSGLLFEPVGSAASARETARVYFEDEMKKQTHLDRISQTFIRMIRQRMGIVYYPLWVLRYLYRGRSFQVVVDGFSGEVLFGKAPGNIFYRAGVLVAGMAAGAFVAVDLTYWLATSEDSDGLGILAVFLFGLVLMYNSYRQYRYGEHYEFHKYKRPWADFLKLPFGDRLRWLERFTGARR
ncbi:MAG TPA: hypothetical protein VLH85_07085 [Levilinea sp.]|nr:hypothetical protein [Levilinea sp.]